MYQGLSDDSKMLYRFIRRTGKILEKKYQIRQSATGIGGMDKVWLMSIDFDRYGDPINEQEARKLIIACVDDFLEAVNNDEELRPFLQDFPFTAKNLELRIFNFDKNQELQSFPFIAIVTDSRGKIGFLTKDPNIKYGYKTDTEETYDEAVAILKQEKQTKLSN